MQKKDWQYNQLWLMPQRQNEVNRSCIVVVVVVGWDSAVGIATCYGMDSPGI
jgi:hypothetical protein